MNAGHEHEFEAAPGLPEPLPRGEQLLWQGRPDWRSLAVHAFHVRKIAVYFAIMLTIQVLYLMGEPGPFQVASVATSLVMATVALGLLAATAWMSSRTTLYTVTDRRIVMRIGIVLTLTFNLPLQRIASAALSPHGRTGDIALSLVANERIGYFHLWPHARAWELRRPQPTLRCITDAAAVGALIQRQWMAVHPQSQVVQTEANPGTPSSLSPAGTPLGEPRHQPEAVTA